MNYGILRAFTFCSNAYAIEMSKGSLHAQPEKVSPKGFPACEKSAGTVMDGVPVAVPIQHT